MPLDELDLRAIPLVWHNPRRVVFEGAAQTLAFIGDNWRGDSLKVIVEKRGSRTARLVTATKMAAKPDA